MDTPRSNLGDATYISRPPPDFDMTQEPSFHSPSKDNNLLQQLRNGRAASLRTPRGNRAPFGDRRNLPAGIGGAEFTPMLKSATRNSARRRGKENTNGVTPALGKIDEDMDMTNVPVDTSLYGPSRNMSYINGTPFPEVDASSTASTPLLLPTRRGGNDKGPLQDGNQLSLREQENVIDKIEKENFGLKLKIHFLEEALSKAGPGFSEAALKENTELKVDKVTMQRELSKYKKHLASAEKDLESYQQQILEVQERATKKYADQTQKAENDALRQRLEDREAKIEELQRELQRQSQDADKLGPLRDEIVDLEADLREKDREINDREDEIDNLNTKLDEMMESWKTAEEKITDLQQLRARPDVNAGRMGEMQDKIDNLEADLQVMDRAVNERENEIDDLKADLKKAEEDRNVAEQRIADFKQQHQSRADANAGTISELQEKIHNLEAGLREKDRTVNERENEINHLRTDLRKTEESRQIAEQKMADFKQHQSRADANAGTINVLQDKIHNLEAELREMDQAANERENENEDLKTELERAQENQQTAEQRLTEFGHLQTQLDVSAGMVKQLQEKIHGLEVNLRAKDLEADAREDELDDLHARLQAAEARWQTAADDKAADFKQHQARADANAGKIGELQEKIFVLQDKIHDLELELRSKERDAGRRETEIDDLKTDVKKLEESRKAALQRNTEFEQLQSRPDVDAATINDLQEKIRDLEVDLRTRLREAEGREDEIDDLQAKLAATEERWQEAEDKVVNSKHHQARADANANRISELQDKIRELESDLFRQRQSRADANANMISELQDKIRELESDLFRQRQSRADANTNKIGELQDKIRELEADLFAQRQEQADANANKIEELQAKIHGLKSDLLAKDREADEREDEIDDINTQLAATEERWLAAEDKLTALERQQSRADANAGKIEELQEKIESLEDEVEVLQTMLEESEDRVKQLRGTEKLCQELRQKLDRIRNERAMYKASIDRLQSDNIRLMEGAEGALSWIQAKKSEKPATFSPGPIRKATMATFRYGDVVMDVVDQKDHEAVIRAADSAQRRHEKEIRGMLLHVQYLEARCAREQKMRRDNAFAKKYLLLKVNIAEACNRADLRMLNRIHQDLGLKSTEELSKQKQKARKTPNKLKVFFKVIRAVARMRVDSQRWAAHENVRKQLEEAWAEQNGKVSN